MSQHVFVLTGAGVSAESGLGTFRDKKGEGIWAKFDPMKLATPQAFARDPQTVLAFYDARRRNLIGAEPNPAHFALARLERGLAAQGGGLTLVTQNIDDCPECARSGVLRPDVVWFGELPLHLHDIDRALRNADLFVAIGTSGAVYPAAGFVAEARAYGVPTFEINLEAADNAHLFDDARYGPASETVPGWVEEFLGT